MQVCTSYEVDWSKTTQHISVFNSTFLSFLNTLREQLNFTFI